MRPVVMEARWSEIIDMSSNVGPENDGSEIEAIRSFRRRHALAKLARALEDMEGEVRGVEERRRVKVWSRDW